MVLNCKPILNGNSSSECGKPSMHTHMLTHTHTRTHMLRQVSGLEAKSYHFINTFSYPSLSR